MRKIGCGVKGAQLTFWTSNKFGDGKFKGRIDYEDDDDEKNRPYGVIGSVKPRCYQKMRCSLWIRERG